MTAFVCYLSYNYAFDGGRLRFLYMELVDGRRQCSAIAKLFLAYFWLENCTVFWIYG